VRIHAALEAFFLDSDPGREVNKPPPENVASKVYFRNWLFQRQTGSKEMLGSLLRGIRITRMSKKEKNFKNVLTEMDVLKDMVVEVPKSKVCKPSSIAQCEVRMGSQFLQSEKREWTLRISTLCLPHT
jgi:hypothetical protein